MADANAVPADPLLSWNDGAVKRSIQAFVQAVANPHSADFVPRAARIAVFDNDGTLWNEQPLYIQLAFALDRVKALAPEHPEWYTTQPFQAVLAHGFKTYIVSGGGIEFMRVIAEQLYGIPPEQVIGSSGKLKYELRNGEPVIVRLPELDFFDDKEGKPAAIQKFIGRRPIAAFGNSDGDLQMLQWPAAGAGRRLMVLVDHTDGEREFDYRISPNEGRLEAGLCLRVSNMAAQGDKPWRYRSAALSGVLPRSWSSWFSQFRRGALRSHQTSSAAHIRISMPGTRQ